MTTPDPAARPHVVVVGGGIAGLGAALRLSEAPGLRVTVLEQSPRVGGKLALAEVGGASIDVGAESMLHRRPEGAALVEALGLGADLVHPATTAARLWTRDRLVPLPRTLLGVPGDPRTLAPVLSAAGLARASAEEPTDPLAPGDDVSVGDLVQKHFGAEVVDRLVDPMLGGVYAGHARALSLRAAVPQVALLAEQGGPLTQRVGATLAATAGSAAPVFAGLRGGLGRLPGEAVRALESRGVVVRVGAAVRVLDRHDHGWRLVVGSSHHPEELTADAVVLATPATPTARLLGDTAPAAAAELAAVDYASLAIVTLAVEGLDVAGAVRRSGSGFLVPPVDGHTIKAATLSFAKWDWVRDAGGPLLLRASVGRHGEEAVLQVPDEELVAVAVREVGRALGEPLRVLDGHVQRWGGGLPQYAVGHLERVERVRRLLAPLPALAVCGAAYDGVGIPACLASARRAADEVVEQLRGSHPGVVRMEP